MRKDTFLLHRRLAALAIICALVLAACGSDEDTAEAVAVEESTTSSQAEDTAEQEENAQQEEAAEPADDGVDLTSELFPDVLDATATLEANGTWTFSATLSSPYDTPERYADAWRVMGADGEVYGIRELTHDHASEQPFTRNHSDIKIPDDVTTVIVEGRDQISGWGGATVEVQLTR